MIPLSEISSALDIVSTDPTAGHRRLLDLLAPLVAVIMPPCAGWSDPRTFDEYQRQYQASWYVQWGGAFTRLHQWIVDQAHKHPAEEMERRARNVILKGYRRGRELKTRDDAGRPSLVIAADDKDTMGLDPRTAKKRELFPVYDPKDNLVDVQHAPDDRRRAQIEKTIDRRDLQPYARTPFQRHVAGLAADGFSNPQIASKLGKRDTRGVAQAVTTMQRNAQNTCLEKRA